MCNLYSITTNQEAIIRLLRVINRYVGNLAPMPASSRTIRLPSSATSRVQGTKKSGVSCAAGGLSPCREKQSGLDVALTISIDVEQNVSQ